MGIFDRLKRLARSEINEMKRVLSERDDGPDYRSEIEREEDARRRAIREAEEELARAEEDLLAAEFEQGAAAWEHHGAPISPIPTGAPADDEVARGAAMWGQTTDRPRGEPASAGGSTTPPKEAPRHYEGRTHAFPREVRDAYAALELPLGSTREQVEAAFRDLLHRYHPDKHAGDARRQNMAHELTIRIREARDVLQAFLAQGG